MAVIFKLPCFAEPSDLECSAQALLYQLACAVEQTLQNSMASNSKHSAHPSDSSPYGMKLALHTYLHSPLSLELAAPTSTCLHMPLIFLQPKSCWFTPCCQVQKQQEQSPEAWRPYSISFTAFYQAKAVVRMTASKGGDSDSIFSLQKL